MRPIVEVFENLENPDPNYARLYGRFGYPDRIWPWSQLAQKSPRSSRFLDLGCGTGYVAVPLLKLGYETIGVDANPQMLAIARKYCPELKTICGRIQQLNLGDRFDGVICSSTLLNLCPIAERERLLERAIAHLKPEGWLGIELFSSAWLKQATMFEDRQQKVCCDFIDFEHQVWYGKIEYFFDDAHYLQRFFVNWLEEEQLRAILDKWGLTIGEQFTIEPLQSIYVARDRTVVNCTQKTLTAFSSAMQDI
ncbi:methyltransferase domain-containing protein [Oxynema sp. CENA135]|uniref:class I SAM-dependent methyltransferase n=1 Tax=Oxynema sp. CENA135 TaxID=984206 RepID=UPI00190A79F0|nr:class I SAM-dependent methyltransferase [Oxynema sp. CENA135]MBK4730049.1 methyltransferase domain-containing protein [Oxynema sp. CENA135]